MYAVLKHAGRKIKERIKLFVFKQTLWYMGLNNHLLWDQSEYQKMSLKIPRIPKMSLDNVKCPVEEGATSPSTANLWPEISCLKTGLLTRVLALASFLFWWGKLWPMRQILIQANLTFLFAVWNWWLTKEQLISGLQGDFVDSTYLFGVLFFSSKQFCMYMLYGWIW